MKSIQIVCPVFREEEVILEFHERLRTAIAPLRGCYVLSFLYVMDPSPDRTESILQQLAAADPEVDVLVMSRRFGHQAVEAVAEAGYGGFAADLVVGGLLFHRI